MESSDKCGTLLTVSSLLDMRSIFESREGNSKIYSWTAFVWGAILSELPYRIVAGTLYCKLWTCMNIQ